MVLFVERNGIDCCLRLNRSPDKKVCFEAVVNLSDVRVAVGSLDHDISVLIANAMGCRVESIHSDRSQVVLEYIENEL